MLQAANTDIYNPLVPKARNSECQNLLFPLQIKPVNLVKVVQKSEKAVVCGFLLFAPSSLMG